MEPLHPTEIRAEMAYRHARIREAKHCFAIGRTTRHETLVRATSRTPLPTRARLIARSAHSWLARLVTR